MQHTRDPMNCIARLRRILSAPEWPAAEAGDVELHRQCAGELALGLGRCRLLGVEPPEDLDATLGPDLTALATLEWCERLGAQVCVARKGARVQIRWLADAWMAFLAIDEGFQTALEADADNLIRILALQVRLMDAMDALDATARAQAPLPTEGEFPGNIVANLAEPYSLALPWWLRPTTPRTPEPEEGACESCGGSGI